MATRKAVIAVCDNPECDKEFEESKDEPAQGYHILKGFWVLGGGGPIPKTYACSIECLAPAIEARISEEW